jgi:hypothetical protein
MRRMIGFLLGVLLLGVARSMRTGAWCLRGSAASGGHRTAALVGMGLGLARPVALMVERRRTPRVRDTPGTPSAGRSSVRRLEDDGGPRCRRQLSRGDVNVP